MSAQKDPPSSISQGSSSVSKAIQSSYFTLNFLTTKGSGKLKHISQRTKESQTGLFLMCLDVIVCDTEDTYDLIDIELIDDND